MPMRQTLLFSSLLAAFSAQAQLVINEVDYDQIGTDNAEFLELKNTGDVPFVLSDVQVVMINGNNGGAAEYRTISNAAWPDLAAGAYFVICGNQGLTLNCDHAATPTANLIQNGPTDAIVLQRVTIDGPVVLDRLSYGGTVPGYAEGNGTTAVDSNDDDGLSLGRWPDGADTGDNNADFVVGCSTPGVVNVLDPVNCSVSTSIPGMEDTSLFSAVSGVQQGTIDLRIQQRETVPVRVSVLAMNGSLLAERDFGVAASLQWTIPVGHAGQLVLVRVQAGVQVLAQRVLVP